MTAKRETTQKPRARKERTRTVTRRQSSGSEGSRVETWDLVAVAEKHRRNARTIVSIFDDDGFPDWFTNLIMLGLETATEKTRIEHWKGEAFDLRGLADLLAVSDSFEYESALRFVPEMSLPELISAVLKHPNTPDSLQVTIGEAVADLGVDDSTPDYIRLALSHHAQQLKKGEA